MKLSFLGAAGTVTGSKFLLEGRSTRILIDCGIFQGLKELRLRNWQPLPFEPSDLDAVFLTHAHIDHTGYLPRLVSQGYRGKIYCTSATQDLCTLLLPDSGALQEEDAFYANKKGFSKHHPALPLYTREEALQTLRFFEPLEFEKPFRLEEFEISFIPAGHILSAGSILVRGENKSILFSGDLGRFNDPIVYEPSPPKPCDVLLMESTYGNRIHPKVNALEEIKKSVEKIRTQGGVLLVPAFAVGRTQLLLYYFYQLFTQSPELRVPIFINSPMATDVTKLYYQHRDLHRLSESEVRDMCQMARFVQTVEESKDLNRKQDPMIIISASGMITGGRILHHLKAFAGDPNTIILLAGFQAPGTRGGALLQGAKTLKIHGEIVDVRAQVVNLDMFSAHADQEDLLRWLKQIPKPPKQIYLIHGEPTASATLKETIETKLHFNVEIAQHRQTVNL